MPVRFDDFREITGNIRNQSDQLAFISLVAVSVSD
jgi:hypothetical protein